MEPNDGEEHYTEKLVRLPGLSFPYVEFSETPPSANRTEFGLPKEKCIFFCAQMPQKYRPQDDDLYPKIARSAPNSYFIFIEGRSFFDMSILQRRLDTAFKRCGLDPAEHYKILSRMPQTRYTALNTVVDVFLDSMGWSGCNTTLEALQHGIPIVTMPGKTMRSRHATGILKCIGVGDTIAKNTED